MQETWRDVGSTWVRKIPWMRAWQPIPFLAWRIPWTEEPGRLQSRGSQRVIHTGSDEHARNWILQAGELQQRSTPRVVTVIIMQRTWQPIIHFVCLYCFSVVAKSWLILWGPHGLACQAPLSMGLPRQGYWSGCHFLLHGIFPAQGMNMGLLHRRQILHHWTIREALCLCTLAFFDISYEKNKIICIILPLSFIDDFFHLA